MTTCWNLSSLNTAPSFISLYLSPHLLKHFLFISVFSLQPAHQWPPFHQYLWFFMTLVLPLPACFSIDSVVYSLHSTLSITLQSCASLFHYEIHPIKPQVELTLYMHFLFQLPWPHTHFHHNVCVFSVISPALLLVKQHYSPFQLVSMPIIPTVYDSLSKTSCGGGSGEKNHDLGLLLFSGTRRVIFLLVVYKSFCKQTKKKIISFSLPRNREN